jgi:hypothetical protein
MNPILMIDRSRDNMQIIGPILAYTPREFDSASNDLQATSSLIDQNHDFVLLVPT